MRHIIIFLALTLSACGPAKLSARIPTPGPVGPPGQGCSIVQATGGALITCGPDSVLILNGQNGADGADGLDAPAGPYNIVETILPCGPQSGPSEVLLRLGTGQIVAHYASGARQFLTLLGPGNYVTTDGYACNFSVGPAPQYEVN
jgi:hypothetical protein